MVKSARDGQKDAELNVSQFMTDVDQDNIQEITVNGMEVRGKLRNNSAFHTTVPANYFTPEMLKTLQTRGSAHASATSTAEACRCNCWALGLR